MIVERSNAMSKPERVIWKIVVGAVLVVVSISNIGLYTNGSTQANAALAMTALMIFGGCYLIYKGLYPDPE